MLQHHTPTIRSQDLAIYPLPVPLTSFIGRQQEMADVKQLLASSRLVTLTGAGGCGKTRLALHVACDLRPTYPDGVCWVDLAPLADPSLLPQAIAQALHILEQPGRALLDVILDFLQHKCLLLVLDNCEHLASACAGFGQRVLCAAPQISILATSREPLAVMGEVLYPLAPLALPPASQVADVARFDSIGLFVERARQVLPNFTLTASNALPVADICRRLDGIPLAIELASARVNFLTVEQIAARLDDRFALLTSSQHGMPSHHRTLLAALDWSYSALSAQEQTLLCRLSVFLGGCTLDAVEQVCGGEGIAPEQVAEGLSSLVNKSLVVAETLGPGEARYRMLETIRQYAREKLFHSGEIERIRNRHLDFYVKYAEYAEPRLKGAEQLEWLDKLDIEHDNLRAAIGWSTGNGQMEAAFRIMKGIYLFWHWRVIWSESRESMLYLFSRPEVAANIKLRANLAWMIARHSYMLGMLDSSDQFADQAITLARELGERQALAMALNVKGMVLRDKGDVAGAVQCLLEEVSLLRQVGDKFSLSFALGNLGTNERDQGKTQLARACYEEAIAVAREIGNEMGTSWINVYLGSLAYYQGDYGFAQTLYAESLTIERKFGQKRGVSYALDGLGLIATAQGEYAAARTFFQDSFKLSREGGEKTAIADRLNNLCHVARLEGDLETARALAEEGLKIAREMGSELRKPELLASLGQLAVARGDYATARMLLEECLAIRKRRNLKLDIPSALQSLGDVSFLQGDHAQARAHYETGLALAREMELKPMMAYSLRMLGYLELQCGNTLRAEEWIKESFQFNAERKLNIGMIRGLPAFAASALARGHAHRAARLLGATQALLVPMHAHLESVDGMEYGHSAASAREQLGESAFKSAWDEGKQMTMEQAVEYALQEERAPMSSQVSAAPTYPAGLTEREVEVLRWLARGLTNQAIAEKLVLSRRTVHAHLRSIYGKLNVTTRNAATRVAIENKII